MLNVKSIVSHTAMLALTFLPRIAAHTRFTTLFINGASQGDGTCIRMDMDAATTSTFVSGITAPEMACGTGGEQAVDRTCPANAGDSISLLHRAWADGAQPGFIDPSHKGSCAIYMKRVADPTSQTPYTSSPTGDGWFKIFYDGYDTAAGKWCTEKMIASNGLMTTNLPSDLAPGYYLIRSEILTLQNVVNSNVNPQFYIGCAQVFVQGSGSARPNSVSIPGYISSSDPAMTFNIYRQPLALPFTEFGPGTYSAVSSQVRTRDPTPSSTDFIGSCPPSTVLTVGNWCGVELPAWTDDIPGSLPACWSASQKCWAANTDCWSALSPAVNGASQSVGCNLWDAKCARLVDWCRAGNTYGPPGQGTVLTPVSASVDPGSGIVKRSFGDKRGEKRMRRGMRGT